MKNIIIQETDASILEMITIALSLDGLSVVPIKSCSEDFLTLIDKHRPHAILLEYFLDGANCIESCRQIKSIYPRLPVIALSCNNHINELYEQGGFDDYIRKPFDLAVLYKVLRKQIPKETTSNTEIEVV
ncbi:MAG: response regulator [Bacteroidota bacterium]|nr:response regulator [Bacteroidota bacterium]